MPLPVSAPTGRSRIKVLPSWASQTILPFTSTSHTRFLSLGPLTFFYVAVILLQPFTNHTRILLFFLKSTHELLCCTSRNPLGTVTRSDQKCMSCFVPQTWAQPYSDSEQLFRQRLRAVHVSVLYTSLPDHHSLLIFFEDQGSSSAEICICLYVKYTM
ncbi:hypothetical protein BDP27DRAFT_608301 [Rhodocollybia butyracea]|uniref:Uncharacterized protein n=1 Tax=Rhodocollybia butyracea TaxID=206335 RepID=A0A9P5UFL1_9AGAR|nr:hypothetical protein BDP27DRAFT_608301 [Rhodocollybia butyracea]